MNRQTGEPEPEKQVRVIEIGTLTARYVERTGIREEKQVAVYLEQRRAEAGVLHTQRMRCDLGRLEEAVRRGAEFEQALGREPREPHWDTPDRVERVGPYKASFFESTSPKGNNCVDVHLEQHRDKASTRYTQEMWCSLERLKEVVRHGLEVERELGQQRSWYLVVRPGELLGPGVARAEVVAAFRDQRKKGSLHALEEAEIYAHKTSNPERRPQELVAYPTPLGWRPLDGEQVDVVKGVSPELDKHFRCYEMNIERHGRWHILAAWHDQEREPTPEKMLVAWDPASGVDYRGEPQDYKAGPAEGPKNPGDPKKPLWIVFNPHERKVIEVFGDRRGAVRCFHELESLERARELQREAMQRLRERRPEEKQPAIDLGKESFGPGR